MVQGSPSSLQVPKAGLDRALGSLGWWEECLPMAGVGITWALRSLSTQTIPLSYDSFSLNNSGNEI